MHPTSDSPENQVDALDYLLVLVKFKKFILGACVATFILSAIVSFLLPDIYIATTRIVTPQNEQAGLSSMLSGVSDIAALAGVSTGGTPGDLYISILQSRSIKDAIITEFDLMESYGEDYWVEMRERMDDIVEISLGKNDGIITLSVEDEDPERAANIANEYIRELKKINLQINYERADMARVFYQERLQQVVVELQLAESRFAEFQVKNKTIKIDEQTGAIIDVFSALQSEVVKKEVELSALLSYQTVHNPRVKALQESIKELNRQIKSLDSPVNEDEDVDIFLSTSQMPELSMQYANLIRDLKVQEALFDVLTRQLEISKMEAEQKSSAIQELDKAVAPDKKNRPKRALIVFLATVVTGGLATIIAFVREYRERMSEKDLARWRTVQKGLFPKRS